MDASPNHRPSALISPALERKLVTIREITEVRRTCRLRLKGLAIIKVSGDWEVVIRKRNFKVGDHVLFFEPDSFIPLSSATFGREMRDLLEDFDGERGYHIQPRTVSKSKSNGHVTAIEDFRFVRHIVDIMKDEYGPEEGLRVAAMMAFEDVIHVKKWEAPNEPGSA